MKLYTNNRGEWVGTQADARKQFGNEMRIIEVPVDKTNLMAFLNDNQVGSFLVHDAPEPEVEPQSEASQPANKISANPNRYDLMDASDAASLQDLQTVMYRYLMRVDDALDLKRIKNEQK
tara:strand:- start:566 stop:925 length:360 start_codon:yes stop_codon:yes gene_type:complete